MPDGGGFGAINESLNARLATESRNDLLCVVGVGIAADTDGGDGSSGAGGKANVGAGRGGGAIEDRCDDDGLE